MPNHRAQASTERTAEVKAAPADSRMKVGRDYRDAVPLLLEDELRGKELQNFRKHIADCTDCKELRAEEEALSRLLHRTRPLYNAPEALHSRVSGILSSEIRSGFHVSERPAPPEPK